MAQELEHSETTRIVYLDNLRSFCILLLLPLHAYYLLDFTPMAWIAWAPEIFQMHMLFLLAGLFTGYSLQNRAAQNFVRGRLRQLGIPFLLCVLVLNPISLVLHFMYHTGSVGLEAYLGSAREKLASGNFTLHAWFLYCLIAYSLLAPYLVRWLDTPRARKLFEQTNIASLTALAGGSVFAAQTLNERLLDPVGIGYLPVTAMEFFWVFFLGIAFARLPDTFERFHRPDPRVIALAGICACCFLALPALRDAITPFLTVAVSVCLCQSLLWAARRYANVSTPLTESFARDSYGIYVLHWSVLFVVAVHLPINKMSEATAFGLVTISALVLSWMLQAGVVRHNQVLAWLVTGERISRSQPGAIKRGARPSSS